MRSIVACTTSDPRILLIYHALTIVPDTNTCIIVYKAVASMSLDEETRNQTEDDDAPLKQENMLMMELEYKKMDTASK